MTTLARPEPDSMEAFKAATCAKLRGVQCPVHRQSPRVRFDGRSLKDISVNLSGCCNRLLAIANRAMVER